MENRLVDSFSALWDWFVTSDDTSIRRDAESDEFLLKELEKARLDWLTAKSRFNNATDADLIDHAIFSIGAAERRYMYLLKEAKKAGVKQKRIVSEDYFLPELD